MLHATTPPPRRSVQQSPILAQPATEGPVLCGLPVEVKQQDPFFGVQIRKSFGSTWFHGRVVDIDAVEATGEFAYRVEYEDGDAEHLTERDVRAHIWRLSGGPIRRSSATTPPVRASFASSAGQQEEATLYYHSASPLSSHDHSLPSTPKALIGLAVVMFVLVASWLWEGADTSIANRQLCEASIHGDHLEMASSYHREEMVEDLSFSVPEAGSEEVSKQQLPYSTLHPTSAVTSDPDMSEPVREPVRFPVDDEPIPSESRRQQFELESAMPFHMSIETLTPTSSSSRDNESSLGVHSIDLDVAPDTTEPSVDEMDTVLLMVLIAALVCGAFCFASGVSATRGPSTEGVANDTVPLQPESSVEDHGLDHLTLPLDPCGGASALPAVSEDPYESHALEAVGSDAGVQCHEQLPAMPAQGRETVSQSPIRTSVGTPLRISSLCDGVQSRARAPDIPPSPVQQRTPTAAAPFTYPSPCVSHRPIPLSPVPAAPAAQQPTVPTGIELQASPALCIAPQGVDHVCTALSPVPRAPAAQQSPLAIGIHAQPSPAACDASTPVLPISQGQCAHGSSPAAIPTPTRAPAIRSLGAPRKHPRAAKLRKLDPDLVTPDRYRYSKALAQVTSMGFEDSGELREVLSYCQGSVPDVLRELLGQ